MLQPRLMKTGAGRLAIHRANVLSAQASSSGAVNDVLVDNMLLCAIAATAIQARMGYQLALRHCIAFGIDRELYKLVYNHVVKEREFSLQRALLTAERLTRERNAQLYGL